MAMPQLTPQPAKSNLLADPALRGALVRFVRSRAPAAEVEDIVQSTLTDALASPNAPTEPEELRRWIHGIARNKVVDFHRRAGREVMRDPTATAPADEPVAESAPHSARELLHWAENELPDGAEAKSTLEWMLREGDGEKLEHIAEEANLPAPRVRQRVSRMRRHLRARWAAAVAAALLLALVGVVLYRMAEPKPDDIAREVIPEKPPVERAAELRREAFEHCDGQAWQRCLDVLDAAKRIDPAGDAAKRVQDARRAAARGLAPAPAPTSNDDVEAKPPVQKKLAPPAPTSDFVPEPLQNPPLQEKSNKSSEPPPPEPPPVKGDVKTQTYPQMPAPKPVPKKGKTKTTFEDSIQFGKGK